MNKAEKAQIKKELRKAPAIYAALKDSEDAALALLDDRSGAWVGGCAHCGGLEGTCGSVMAFWKYRGNSYTVTEDGYVYVGEDLVDTLF